MIFIDGKKLKSA